MIKKKEGKIAEEMLFNGKRRELMLARSNDISSMISEIQRL